MLGITVRFYETTAATAEDDLKKLHGLPEAMVQTGLGRVKMGYMGRGWVYMIMFGELFGKGYLDIWADKGVPVSYEAVYRIYRAIHGTKLNVFQEMQRLHSIEEQIETTFRKTGNTLSYGTMKERLKSVRKDAMDADMFLSYIMTQYISSGIGQVADDAADLEEWMGIVMRGTTLGSSGATDGRVNEPQSRSILASIFSPFRA